MYIDRSLYETVHFWKEPTAPTAVADCQLHSEEDSDALHTKNNQREVEVDKGSDDDDEEGVTLGDREANHYTENEIQKSSGCITLSSVPKAHWATLFHLEAIKQRSKPIEPPAKRPLAPFFLPSVVIGGSTPSFPTPQEYRKILQQQQQLSHPADDARDSEGVSSTSKRAHFESDVALVEGNSAVVDEPLPSVWNDNDEEEVGWRIDTSAGTEVNIIHDDVPADVDESALVEEENKSRKSSRTMSKILRRKDKMPR
jgi:hypothetical protein